MLLRDLVSDFTGRFAAAGIESAAADAQILISETLGISRGELSAFQITGTQITDHEFVVLNELALRREAREPLQHLTGRAYFRNLVLDVGPGVFVPRPDTELIAQLAIDALRAVLADNPAPVAVDLATGSGAIALAIATEVPEASVYAVELSDEALTWTRKNFARYQAEGAKAHLSQGDLADAFEQLNGQVDVLATNPPYIPLGMVPIYPEVQLHDPALALYSGDDGLDAIRLCSKSGLRLVRSGGYFVVEHADIQSASVVELLRNDGWTNVTPHQDLNQRFRAVSATRP